MRIEHTIMEALDLSKLAYKDKHDVEYALMMSHALIHYIDLPAVDVQGFVCTQDRDTWIVIRGTEIDNIADWETNFDFTKTISSWGEVHKGYHIDSRCTMHSIERILRDVSNRGDRVIFTGHSQGAAVALQMFASFMNWNPGHKAICIPIEAPRSFSKEAAKLFGNSHGSKVYPVIHNNDIIHNIPPRCMDYAHVSNTNLQYIDRKGKVHHKISKWNRFKDSMLGYIRSWSKLKLDSLSDHSISNIRDIWRKQL